MRKNYATWRGQPRRFALMLSMIQEHGDSDECLIWPFNKRSDKFKYGIVYYEKRRQRVHRLVFRLIHGGLDPSLEVLHSCDNPPCFNPKHLRQGVQADNIKDIDLRGRRRSNGRPGILRGPNPLLQGEHSGKAKLTTQVVAAIRAAYETGLFSQREVAEQYGTTRENVSQIVQRRSWKHL